MGVCYRLRPQDIFDQRTALIHARNGDEIGLSGRQLAIARALRLTAKARQKEAAGIYFADGLAQEEVSRCMGVTCGTVSRLIQHCIQNINVVLAACNMELLTSVRGTEAKGYREA